jgi:mRNA interferase MazF
MTAISDRPPWIKPRLLERRPLAGNVKTRPVIVVSYKNTLHGPCLVVPVSTEPQDDNPWAHRLSIDIEGKGVVSWAVCNQPTTMSPSRFSQFQGNKPLLPKADFNQVLEKLLKFLPAPLTFET